MHTIIYTRVKDQNLAIPKLKELRIVPKDKASARVIEFWKGEIEQCDQVLVGDGCEKVAEAYSTAGTTVKPLFEAPKPVEVVDPVVVAEPVVDVKAEPEVQQEYRGRGRPRKDA